MRKLLLAIYLTLMVSTLNGETVKKENVKWIKLSDYNGKDIKNIEKGVIYQEVKGKNYKCGEVINGKREGKWIEYYENGQKREEITYRDGDLIKGLYWKKNGEMIEIFTITNTGEKKVRLTDNLFENLSILVKVDNGTAYKKIGGKDYKCGEIKDGKLEGNWIEYYGNGQKRMEGNYVKGEEEGKWIVWHENGKKESEGNYKNGKKEGEWIKWDLNGKKKKILIYKNDEIVDMKEVE